MDDLPGIDRGTLIASFSGAIAFLCVQDKMPALKAVGYVFAGGTMAVYVGPAVVDLLSTYYHVAITEKVRYGVVFFTGVCGIWLINLVLSLLQAGKDQSSDFMRAAINRLFRGGSSGDGK